MKTSGLKKHVNEINEITCPRCEGDQVLIRNVALHAHDNGMTVEIDLGCSICDDNFQLELWDGPNISVYGHLKFSD